MRPDVKENLDFFAEIELDEASELETYFDPVAFNKKHDPLTLNEYRFDEDQLKEHGIKVSQLRAKIESKADSLKAFEAEPIEIQPPVRSRLGLKHSTK